MSVKYADLKRIEYLLKSKVRFTNNVDEQPDRMPYELLEILTEEAEADVEHDLSPRYDCPFQTCEGAKFINLPENTRLYIQTMCHLKALMRILEHDFGKGSAASGEAYSDVLKKRYDTMKAKQLELKPNTYNNWLYPPLKDLKRSQGNEVSDDGYDGEVFVTSDGRGDYAADQINDPSASIFTGKKW